MNARSRSPRTAGLAGTVAASMVSVASQNGRGPGAEISAPGRSSVRSVLVGRCLDGLVERQLAALDRVDAVVREGRVAILVDGVRAEHAGAILRLEDRLQHVRLLARAGALDGVQREAHGLVAVDGVRVGVLLAVLLLEVSEELLSLRRVLVRREGRDRDLHLRGQGAVVRRFLVDRRGGGDREALLLGGVLDVPREAGPIHLLVGQYM